MDDTSFNQAPATSWDQLHPNSGQERIVIRKKGPGLGPWLLGLVVLVLVSAAGIIYYALTHTAPAPALEVAFATEGEIFQGQPFTLSVTVANVSIENVNNVRLSLLLPDDTFFVGDSPQQRLVVRPLGDLFANDTRTETFTVIATASSQAVKRFQVKVNYLSEQDAKNEFEKQFLSDISAVRPAISLNLEAPRNIYTGQDFEMAIVYQNNTRTDFQDLRLAMEYPPAFQFVRSSQEGEKDNNQWLIGKLAAGEGGRIMVKGHLVGQENAFYSFKTTLNADFGGKSYLLSDQSPSVSIYPAPLSLRIVLENLEENPDYIAHPEDVLRYRLFFKNNSDLTIREATIRAYPKGAMFDFAAADSAAAFDSIRNVFTWRAGDTPQLQTLPPQAEGSVTLAIPLRREYPIRSLKDRHFTVYMEGDIQSATLPAQTQAQRTFTVSSLETKVAGRAEFSASALWRDPASKIANQGPYPPKVNTPTQYTIHWKIKNFADDLEYITVKANLQSGSRWTGVVKSNVDTKPQFNPNTNQVVWEIPKLPANIGVLADPAEAVFQIEMTPAVNQVGRFVPLLGESILEGTDVFIDTPVTAKAFQLDTALPDDPTPTPSDRGVKP